MMFEFSYNLDDTDYLEFNKSHLNTASANRKIVLLLRLFFPAMLVLLSLLDFVYHEDWTELPLRGIVYAIIAVVWIFAVKPLLMLSVKANMKAMKKDGKLPYGKNVRIQFDEEGIYEATEVAESKVKYSNIEKIAEGNRAVYIYFGSAQAFIIPFSAFETEEQKKGFLTFINEKKPCKSK